MAGRALWRRLVNASSGFASIGGQRPTRRQLGGGAVRTAGTLFGGVFRVADSLSRVAYQFGGHDRLPPPPLKPGWIVILSVTMGAAVGAMVALVLG